MKRQDRQGRTDSTHLPPIIKASLSFPQFFGRRQTRSQYWRGFRAQQAAPFQGRDGKIGGGAASVRWMYFMIAKWQVARSRAVFRLDGTVQLPRDALTGGDQCVADCLWRLPVMLDIAGRRSSHGGAMAKSQRISTSPSIIVVALAGSGFVIGAADHARAAAMSSGWRSMPRGVSKSQAMSARVRRSAGYRSCS